MSKRVSDEYNNKRLYNNELYEDENYVSQDCIQDEIEDEKYYYEMKDDIFEIHKQILDFIVDNNLDLCEYVDIDSFENFLIQNKIIE